MHLLTKVKENTSDSTLQLFEKLQKYLLPLGSKEEVVMGSGEDVIVDLDATLDQLIQNGKTLRQIEARRGFETEIEALKKTQESLLARVCHRQQLLKERTCGKRAEIEEKMRQYLANRFSSRPARRRVTQVSRRRQRARSHQN